MPENNQILSVEGQLVGMPLAGPESFSQQQLDYLKTALGFVWLDVSEEVSTSGTGLQLLYMPATGVCVLTIVRTANITGTNTLGTIPASYRPATSIISASAALNNNAYCRGYVESTGNIGLSATASANNVGIRFFATWVVGK